MTQMDSASSEIITIYTDGSTKTNPGIGAWAAIVIKPNGQEIILTKSYDLTTNNRMEMLGIIEPIEKILNGQELWSGDKPSISVFSDSKYTVNVIEEWIPLWSANQWRTNKGSKAKNTDLLARLATIKQKTHLIVTWVKGHADNKYNNRCDVLARDALCLTKKYKDVMYESGTGQR